MRANAFCDGSGNSSKGGSCASVLHLPDGTLVQKAIKLGKVTNNIAEYEGVILSLLLAKEFGVKHLVIHSDSQVVVNQLEGVYQARNEDLSELRDKAINLALDFLSVEIKWIPRKLNSRSDSLCRKEKKGSSDEYFRVVENPVTKIRAQLSL